MPLPAWSKVQLPDLLEPTIDVHDRGSGGGQGIFILRRAADAPPYVEVTQLRGGSYGASSRRFPETQRPLPRSARVGGSRGARRSPHHPRSHRHDGHGGRTNSPQGWRAFICREAPRVPSNPIPDWGALSAPVPPVRRAVRTLFLGESSLGEHQARFCLTFPTLSSVVWRLVTPPGEAGRRRPSPSRVRPAGSHALCDGRSRGPVDLYAVNDGRQPRRAQTPGRATSCSRTESARWYCGSSLYS